MVLIKISGDVFMLTWIIIYFAGLFDMGDINGIAYDTVDETNVTVSTNSTSNSTEYEESFSVNDSVG